MAWPAQHLLTTITGLVVATTASRDRANPRRQMRVRTEGGRMLTGSIPHSLRYSATTLAGRRVQFRAVVNDDTGRFCHPTDGTILAPRHLAPEERPTERGRPIGGGQPIRHI